MTKYQIPNTRYQRGFTLIEAVVATAVFAFVVSSVMAVYAEVLKLDRKTRAQRAVYDNARFITEFLGKEIRNGSISYGSYPNGTVPINPDLYLSNQNNELERVYLNGTNMVLAKNGVTTNLNSNAVQVTRLRFYVIPGLDPYTPAKASQTHPSVTVIMELASNTASETTKINLQSTFSTRSYPSRQSSGDANP